MSRKQERSVRTGAVARIVVALAVVGLATPTAAQEPARDADAGVVLDFQEADLRVVLSALGELAGMNVIFTELPPVRVTVRTPGPVTREVIRQYVASLVQAYGLEMSETGDVVRIRGTPRESAEQRAAAQRVADGSEPRLYVYRLRHAQADALAQTLGALFGLGSPAAGTGRFRALSDELRGQRVVPPADAFRPAAAPVARVDGGLQAALEGPVQIVPDLRTNSLLVRATSADYRTIEEAVRELDTRPLQVLIEVMFVEVRRSRQSALGLGVEVPEQPIGSRDVLIGGSVAGAAAGDVTLRIRNLGAIQADVVVRALAAASDVSVLSRPIILTQNNRDARILVGDQRPFIQLFRSLPTDGAVRDQIVQYRDVGTQLSIRPTINPDGYVTLDILQEVSNATTETQFGAPVISTREAETQLLVKDGHTVVLGGLMDQQNDRASSGIPILKDIPLLGALFRTSQRRRSVTELFLILTPHVIRTDEDLQETRRQLEERARLMRRAVPEPGPLLDLDTLPPPPDRP